jgi:hypothetical protein
MLSSTLILALFCCVLSDAFFGLNLFYENERREEFCVSNYFQLAEHIALKQIA